MAVSDWKLLRPRGCSCKEPYDICVVCMDVPSKNGTVVYAYSESAWQLIYTIREMLQPDSVRDVFRRLTVILEHTKPDDGQVMHIEKATIERALAESRPLQ